MIQGAREGREQFPMAAIENDCLTGAKDETTAKRLCKEIDTLLLSCGFTLYKWRSNCTKRVPKEDNLEVDEILELSDLDDTTVFGHRSLTN